MGARGGEDDEQSLMRSSVQVSGSEYGTNSNTVNCGITSNGRTNDGSCDDSHVIPLDDAEDASRGFMKLRREHARVLRDFQSMKAQHEIAFMSVRAIFRLGGDATWSDIMERSEALFRQCESATDRMSPRSMASEDTGVEAPRGLRDAEVEVIAAREETRQADLECERLEEKLEAQAAHIVRLRELLQKQQRLLDVTAQQIEGQDEHRRRQADDLSQLDAQESKHRKLVADHESRESALIEECGKLQEELERRCTQVARQEQELRMQSERMRQLEAELQKTREALSASDAQCLEWKSEADRHAAEADRQKKESEKQYAESIELTEKLCVQAEHIEKMRADMQVHESAERRRYSYMPRNGGLGGIGNSSAGTPTSFARSRALSHSHLGSNNGDDSPRSSAAATTVGTESAFGGCASVTAGGGHLSARGTRTSQRTSTGHVEGGRRGGSQRPDRGRPSAQATSIADEERDAFLSHFPMASRTERAFRDRIEERKRRERIGVANAHARVPSSSATACSTPNSAPHGTPSTPFQAGREAVPEDIPADVTSH
eukprot:TRINITY_DN7070_c0_g1_i3.p1 TRINITY_DN7070_c0_g1~~TRINITY_DN7070_c0_g1_i3.p1  ORF type:complete len:575 (-),score=102.85 TRINITY_DN7070_c0_g1_i3:98-1738(-)